MTLRIGIDAAWGGDAFTGTGVYTRTLVHSLLPHLTEARVHLYFRESCRNDNPLFSVDHEALEKHVVDGPRVWRSVRRLGPALKRDGTDVFLSPVCFLPLNARCPCIVTVFDLNVFTMGRLWLRRGVWRKYLVTHLFTRLSLRRADHVVVISGATRDALVRRFPVVEDRCSVVYPAVERASLSAAGQLPPRVRRLADPFFLYVGVMSPTKNLARLIQAFAQVRAETGTMHLVLAGRDSGTYMQRHLQPLIASLGLNDRVHWLGYVSDCERNALYRNALALTFPSLMEGFGYPIVEAMASGLPVMTSNAASCPEVAGDAALIVEAHSVASIHRAMQSLLTDPLLRQTLIEAGRRRADRFISDRMGQTMIELLKRVARTRHGT